MLVRGLFSASSRCCSSSCCSTSRRDIVAAHAKGVGRERPIRRNAARRESSLPVPRRMGRRGGRVVLVRAGEKGGGGDGEKEGEQSAVQELLVDVLRLETGKVRVEEFVKDRAEFLSGIAEQAGEEYRRIAAAAEKTMEEAGSKVLEQVDAEASAIEEELAAARAEMEASERELDEFEKKVERARSEGLFFKKLFSQQSTKPWKAKKSVEEQKEIAANAKAVAEELQEATKRTAASKFRRSAYAVMIIILTLTVLEAVSAGNVEWVKLTIYALLLLALVLQLTYETVVSRAERYQKKK